MKRTRIFIGLLVVLFGGLFYFAQHARAQSNQMSVTWVNYSTLVATHDFKGTDINEVTPASGTYKLATGSARPLKYYLEGRSSGASCTPFIEIDLDDRNTFKPKNSIRTFMIKADQPGTDECKEVKKDGGDGITISSYDNWQLMFEWRDESLIAPLGNLPSLDGRPGDRRANYNIAQMGALQKDTDGVFYENTSGCGGKLEKFDTSKTKADFYVANVDASGSCDDDWMNVGRVTIADPIDPTTNTTTSTKPTGTGTAETTSDSTGDAFITGCDGAIPLLGWIACPVIDAANRFVSVLDNAISNELTVDTNFYLDESIKDSPGEKYFRSWSIVRYMSMTLLVIIALVMIISQALGMEIFDAYSIRKVLPRLVVAVIFISLSWSLFKFTVEVSNSLGVGVRQIIYAPFAKELEEGISISGLSTSAAGGAVLAGYLGLGFAGLISLAFTALLAVAIAFVVLVFRKLLIILLIIFSPLAIIASILPGTRRAWKMWSENFFKALLAYPIISAFIAFGRVFAAIADDPQKSGGPIRDQSGTSGLLAQLIVFIAYFGPYFALPLALRLAGGLVATLGGVANDRSRGVFDRLRKGRQARFDDRRARFKMGGVYSRRNPVGKAMNKMGGLIYDTRDQATMMGSKIPGLGGVLGEQASMVQGKIDAAKHKHSEEALKHINSYFGDNDKAYRAIGGMYDGYSDETKRRLIESGFATGTINEDGSVSGIQAKGKLRSYDDYMRFASVLDQSSQETEKKAAVGLRAGAGYLSRMHTKQETNYADTALIGALGLASHGFLNGQDIEAAGRLMSDAKDGGSLEYAHAGLVQAELLAASKGHNEAKPGYGHYIDESGHIRDGLSPTSDRGFAYLGVMDYQAAANFKGDVLKDTRLGGVVADALDVNYGQGEDLETRVEVFKANLQRERDLQLQRRHNGDTSIRDSEIITPEQIEERAQARRSKIMAESQERMQKVVKKWQAQGLTQPQIEGRLEASRKAYAGVKGIMLQLTGPYSSASPDVRQRAAEILERADLGDEMRSYSSRTANPAAVGAAGAPAPAAEPTPPAEPPH